LPIFAHEAADMIINVFAIAVVVFSITGFTWGYYAIKAMRAKRWGIASVRALAAAISFGAVVFEFMLIGALLK